MIYILSELGQYPEDGKYINSIWELAQDLDIKALYNERIGDMMMEKGFDVIRTHPHLVLDRGEKYNKGIKTLAKIRKSYPIIQFIKDLGAKQLEFKEIYV